ncbi:hypothetical protein GCM10017714_02780 [Curtobacterium pusillum]|uniref:Uncharacterized protein n=1 Tax=Curtobacterium pusillum TaxID=69373 RepID=A0ABX2M4F4_9MICO|nr:hypothetical protein [Curtobacterium pusillum]NUU13005.1 hypothetical protein [Curtobacterium pusillum]GLK31229.1 hypothetical protein GCM10017610_15140 [Curtobacterium pusillum]
MQILTASLTRRAALRFASAGAVAFTALRTPSPASAVTTQPTLLATAVRTFATDFSRSHSNPVPSSFTLAASGSGRRTTAVLRFDERFVEWTGDSAVMVHGTTIVSLPITKEPGAIRFDMPGGSVGGGASVHLPLRSAVEYPHENIGPSIAPTLELLNGSQSTTSTFEVPMDEASGVAWGLSTDVGWVAREVSDGSRYWVPSIVVVSSTGPGPVPRGTVITITTDAVLAGVSDVIPAPLTPDDPAADPDAAQSTAKTSKQIAGGARNTIATIEDDLPAGTTFTLEVETGRTSPGVRARALTYAQVSCTAPRASRGMQRRTGRETATANAPGGLPLAEDTFTGRI